MDYKMTGFDISKALKEDSYLDEGHETCVGKGVGPEWHFLKPALHDFTQ